MSPGLARGERSSGFFSGSQPVVSGPLGVCRLWQTGPKNKATYSAAAGPYSYSSVAHVVKPLYANERELSGQHQKATPVSGRNYVSGRSSPANDALMPT